MEKKPRTYEKIGLQVPEMMLPRPDLDLSKWAVVACDQYTAQPEYWAQVRSAVGTAPSTLNLTLPEIWLVEEDVAERIRSIQAEMDQYLAEGLLEPFTGLMYVERTAGEKRRRGLVAALDLERYDYTKGSQSLIRATEGTILERIPPRMKIRTGAALEFPHIMVLIDDPQATVIEPLAAAKGRMTKRYDFDLMMDSGHLTGYAVEDPALEAQVVHALEALADPDCFQARYGVGPEQAVLLYAMGDGNHSLATAKAVWEELKPQVGMDHPARYALVEIENVHDQGLEFEPIHRVLFGLDVDICDAMGQYFGDRFEYRPTRSCDEMMEIVETTRGEKQAFGLAVAHQFGVVTLSGSAANLALGTLQPFLDELVKSGEALSIDYVHGMCVICRLTHQPGNVGFFLPTMEKSDLFKTVILDGVLPRKTFSMGEAHEKRFYMEGRVIA